MNASTRELAQSYKSPTAKNQQLRGKEIRLEAQVKDLETTNKTLGEKCIDAKRQLEEKDTAIAAIEKLTKVMDELERWQAKRMREDQEEKDLIKKARVKQYP